MNERHKTLTHAELLKIGICLSADNERILAFDMQEYKDGLKASAAGEVVGLDMPTVLWFDDLKKPEYLNVFLASLHMYQTVFRMAVDLQRLENYLNTALLGARPKLNTILGQIQDMKDICQMAQRIALEGAIDVANNMKPDMQ